jgi:hypothetical protein
MERKEKEELDNVVIFGRKHRTPLGAQEMVRCSVLLKFYALQFKVLVGQTRPLSTHGKLRPISPSANPPSPTPLYRPTPE